MNTTNLSLIALGFLGIVIHSLIKINTLKKAGVKLGSGSGMVSELGAYLSLEWASVCTSLAFVIALMVAKSDIQKLEQAGKYLGLGFFMAGYFGQSLLIAVMGNASKKLSKILGETIESTSTTTTTTTNETTVKGKD